MQQVCKCSLCLSSPYGVKNVPYQGKGQNHIDIPSWLDLVASTGDMLAHMQSSPTVHALYSTQHDVDKTYHKKTSRYRDRIYTIAFELSSRRCHVDEVVFEDAPIGFSLEQSPNVGAFVVEHE